MGADNFFLFGLTAEQVQELKSRGYRPQDYYERQAPLREVLDLIASGGLSGGDTNLRTLDLLGKCLIPVSR
ncbi:MAG TPA: glycogen/starch/alpha-glucan phosphorylase, partial [Candidatus Anammoximicrobium sp.]|nr:glycogen/starch/alpha-glucan phosphorylase [Candidatus Anammoximicrobium sp.]